MEDARTKAGPGRRRFIAGAGVAAAAATAGALATGPTAAASGITTSNVDVSNALKWIDFTNGVFGGNVTLGSGGFANATFSPFGDMVALMLQVQLGTSSNPGGGVWCLDPADPSMSAFAPVGVANIPGAGNITAWWPGGGSVVDLAISGPVNQTPIGVVWQDFSPFMPTVGTVLVFAMGGPMLNTGSGDVLFNWNGVSPFGGTLNDGTIICATTTYQMA